MQILRLGLQARYAGNVLDLLPHLADQIVHQPGELLLAHENNAIFPAGNDIVVFPLEGEIVLCLKMVFQNVARGLPCQSEIAIEKSFG